MFRALLFAALISCIVCTSTGCISNLIAKQYYKDYHDRFEEFEVLSGSESNGFRVYGGVI